MSKPLRQLLLEGLQTWAGIGQPSLLLFKREMLAEAMDFVESHVDAKYIDDKLREYFRDANWAGSAAIVEKVFQLVGEAQFWMLAKQRAVNVERIDETSNKTPDFRLASAHRPSACFEIKTVSVVGGTEALAKMHDQRFESELRMRRQLSAGKRVGFDIQMESPHGEIPDGQDLLTICRVLINKLGNNIKDKQYTGATTFLVANLSIIDGYFLGNVELKPMHKEEQERFWDHTGILWTVAFGQMNDEVRGFRRDEEESNVQGTLDLQGVLVDPQFGSVAGILFIVHPANGDSKLFGAWNSARFADWSRTQPDLVEALNKLVGTDWNDEANSNATNLNSFH